MLSLEGLKSFTNGNVFLLSTGDGYLIETTDTYLPYYTRYAIPCCQNTLKTNYVGSREERWMIGVSTMSGCPVGCKFCATGQLKRHRNLSGDEIIKQIRHAMLWAYPDGHSSIKPSKEFKINYTRMGEPFLNIDSVKHAISYVDAEINPNTHHYISTVGLKGSDFSFIKGNISLQISLHSLDECRRNELIPIKNLMSIEDLGKIRTNSNLKTTVNLTLVDKKDFDISELKKYFDPDYFFIKLSPINPNPVSVAMNMGSGIVEQVNLI